MNFDTFKIEHSLIRNSRCTDTAFILACKYNDLSLAKVLKQLWPNINHHIYDGYPLKQACRNGSFDTTKWLIETWPDIDLNKLNCALEFAFLSKNQDLIEYIIRQYTCESLFHVVVTLYKSLNSKQRLPILNYIIEYFDLDSSILKQSFNNKLIYDREYIKQLLIDDLTIIDDSNRLHEYNTKSARL